MKKSADDQEGTLFILKGELIAIEGTTAFFAKHAREIV